MLVPTKSVTSLGSAIFAFLAAGTFKTIEEAQDEICPPHRIFEPDHSEQSAYDHLYPLFSGMYFSLGDNQTETGDVLPALIRISEQPRKRQLTAGTR